MQKVADIAEVRAIIKKQTKNCLQYCTNVCNCRNFISLNEDFLEKG